MIRVLLVDDIASTLANLQKLLSFEDDIEVCGTASDGSQAVEEARRLTPDIVLMDVNMPVMDGIGATEVLAQELPGCPVIIMSVQGERDYLRRAMQAGAREFLIKPFSGDELIAALRRVYQLEQKKGSYLARHEQPTAEAAPEPARVANAEVFTVFSGKGGVGKSIVAANLAVALAQETGGRVALVDLDLQFGDIGVLLNLDYSRSITDLVESADNLDAESLNDVLASGPGGVRVLLAPISPELADLVNADLVRAVMAELRRSFDFVVVDTSAHLGEVTLEVIESAQRVIVVTALTIPAIKDAKLTLKVLESLNVDSDSVVLVVNRSDAHSDVNRERIEQNLRCPIAAQLPFDPKVLSDAVNRGTPFVTSQPESEISQAIRELVSRLVPVTGSSAAATSQTDRKKSRRFGFGGR
ncbi:MAG: response regulator [Candidatus Dormibacteria bacterium]